MSKTVISFSVPIAVELHVSGHFSIGNSLWGFLKFEDLEIHTLTFVWNNVKWVNWTLRPTCLLTANVRKKVPLVEPVYFSDTFLKTNKILRDIFYWRVTSLIL